MDNIKYSDFQNYCRTCMFTSDLKYIPDTNMVDVLQFLCGTKYSKTDELPQQLCIKCIGIMKDILTFASQCRRIDRSLKTCLLQFKISQNDHKDETNNLELVTEHIIKEEFLFEEMVTKQETVVTDDEQIETKDEQIITKDEQIVTKDEQIPTKQDTIDEPTTTIIKTETPLILETILIKQNDEFRHNYNITDTIENEKVHNNDVRFKCDVCMKGFKYSCHYIQHIKIHSGVRPYQCEICNKTFITNTHLEAHKAMHREERLFECDICLKKFKRPNNLNQHKRVIHSGTRPLNCSVCNRRFRRQTCLDMHMAKHGEKRRFQCDICMKEFNQSSNLIQHKRVKHNGQSPYRYCYQCEVCNKNFSRKSYLLSHSVVHNEDK